MSGLGHLLQVQRKLSVFKVVSPQDGGWSLTPMENLLRGLRGDKDVFVFEVFGRDGVVAYRVRTNNADGVSGMFRSYFPQARLDSKLRDPGEELDVDDWMHLDEDELGMVVPLFLKRPSYLPLRIFDDRTIEQSTMDPLAGVIGVLSTATRPVGPGAGGDRLGMRMIVRPAREDWGAGWQKKMQQRRDGEDRAARPGSAESQGPSFGMIIGVAGIAGIAAGNYWLWQQGNMGGLVGFDVAAGLLGAAGLYGFRRYNAVHARRPYLDEELVDAKLKSLGFHVEVQLVRIYRSVADATVARDSLAQLIECLRSFDDPAGNSWVQSRLRSYSGERIFQGEHHHPFVGGSQEMSWLEPDRAKKTVLSARETASLWHPPLGADEMAPMERTAAGILVPFLADLSQEGGDSGPLVGMAGDDDLEIYLPESSLRKHALIIGKSGVGKSTIVKHVLSHKLERKAQGLDDGAIVVIDPHADLVRDTLKLVPESIAHKVRLLDFGRMDRVPGINLVDPKLFPDRDRCVDTIVNTVKHLWEHWGGRLEDLLKRSLSIIYEWNSHPETRRDEMLTMLDILLLLDDGVTTGSGPNAVTEASNFQKRVLSRVSDPRLKQWFDAYLKWGRETRSEAVGPVHSRVGAYANDMRASVIMGQRESTIMLSDVLSEGLVLLVSTAQGTIGIQPAALMGGTMVSLVEAAMRDQEKIEQSKRSRCMLVCDEFQTVTGANWEGMLAEIRKYGGSLLLATQSLARLDTPERKLKAGILGNIGVILAYQMAAEDAHIIAPEMDSERVQERFLVNANPHNCYARITSDSKVYPTFSMKTLPPPDMTRGSTKAVEAVLEASKAYTVDWQEARERINEEVGRQLSMANKVDVDGSGGDGRGSGGGGRGGRNGGSGGGSRRPGGGGGESGGESRPGLTVPEASQGTLDRLQDLLDERRDIRSRRPGQAFEEAEARGETPFQDRSGLAGLEGRVVVESNVTAGPFRGYRQSDVDSSQLTDNVKKVLLNMANRDPFMRELLDRRERSKLNAEVLRVRREEREKIEAKARVSVADEVREEVRAEALEELTPQIESAERERARIRSEVVLELQSEYDQLEAERANMAQERERIREEEKSNARREMGMRVAVGGVGRDAAGGAALAELGDFSGSGEPGASVGGGDDGEDVVVAPFNGEGAGVLGYGPDESFSSEGGADEGEVMVEVVPGVNVRVGGGEGPGENGTGFEGRGLDVEGVIGRWQGERYGGPVEGSSADSGGPGLGGLEGPWADMDVPEDGVGGGGGKGREGGEADVGAENEGPGDGYAGAERGVAGESSDAVPEGTQGFEGDVEGSQREGAEEAVGCGQGSDGEDAGGVSGDTLDPDGGTGKMIAGGAGEPVGGVGGADVDGSRAEGEGLGDVWVCPEGVSEAAGVLSVVGAPEESEGGLEGPGLEDYLLDIGQDDPAAAGVYGMGPLPKRFGRGKGNGGGE